MTRMKTRRGFAAAVALSAASVLVLAGCGGEATPAGAGASEPAAPAASESPASAPAAAADFPTANGGELNLYNWTDYISPELLKRFETETGITVNLDNFDSNETLLAKLQAGGANYDVIVPSDYMVAQMIELGLLDAVDPSSRFHALGR